MEKDKRKVIFDRARKRVESRYLERFLKGSGTCSLSSYPLGAQAIKTSDLPSIWGM